jgi:translation initiation factor IF-3
LQYSNIRRLAGRCAEVARVGCLGSIGSVPSGNLSLRRFHHTVERERVPVIERNQRINEQIRISPVRVISAEGELLGVLNTEEALARAREAELDLVEVAPNERPPVCRIMDYGKFKYQQKKRLAKGHTHHSKIKEIRVRPKTGEHDIHFKLVQARGFLQHKDKVIVSVIFRGRELAHIEEGRKVIDHVIKELEDVGKIESAPSHQGKRIVAILAPR